MRSLVTVLLLLLRSSLGQFVQKLETGLSFGLALGKRHVRQDSGMANVRGVRVTGHVGQPFSLGSVRVSHAEVSRLGKLEELLFSEFVRLG